MKTNEREGQHPTIGVDDPDFNLWRQYFETVLGDLPEAMKRVLEESGSGLMTVPEQKPQWFDSSFIPDHPAWRQLPFVRRAFPGRRMAGPPAGEDYDSMFARYGRPGHASEAGTKWEIYVGQKFGATPRREFKQFTADDLRRIYAKPETAE